MASEQQLEFFLDSGCCFYFMIVIFSFKDITFIDINKLFSYNKNSLRLKMIGLLIGQLGIGDDGFVSNEIAGTAQGLYLGRHET